MSHEAMSALPAWRSLVAGVPASATRSHSGPTHLDLQQDLLALESRDGAQCVRSEQGGDRHEQDSSKEGQRQPQT